MSSIRFLCDADQQTGLGHFVRSAALARTLASSGYRTPFFGNFDPVARRLAAHFELELIHDDQPINERANNFPTEAPAVIDSYALQPKTLTTASPHVVIDDFCRSDAWPVAGIINFTVDANQYDYVARGAGAQALGTGFFLPHPAIGPPSGHFSPHVSNVLILIGSGDRHGLAPLVLKTLQDIVGKCEIRVIGSYPGSVITAFPRVEFVEPAPDIGRHYDWADFCITSGGLAKYECAWLGKPAAVISQTQGERDETVQFEKHGLCFDLGYCAEVDVANLARRLEPLIADHRIRQQAFELCQSRFKANSSRSAAEFVLDCLY